jgi:hypothetical protein
MTLVRFGAAAHSMEHSSQADLDRTPSPARGESAYQNMLASGHHQPGSIWCRLSRCASSCCPSCSHIRMSHVRLGTQGTVPTGLALAAELRCLLPPPLLRRLLPLSPPSLIDLSVPGTHAVLAFVEEAVHSTLLRVKGGCGFVLFAPRTLLV